MENMEEDYADAITTLRRLGVHPDLHELEKVDARVQKLDAELRRWEGVRGMVEGDDHPKLSRLSREVNSLLDDTYERLGIARRVARAAIELELHDMQNPTVISPQVPTHEINAFARGRDRTRRSLGRVRPLAQPPSNSWASRSA